MGKNHFRLVVLFVIIYVYGSSKKWLHTDLRDPVGVPGCTRNPESGPFLVNGSLVF